jgi:hypothetical protein
MSRPPQVDGPTVDTTTPVPAFVAFAAEAIHPKEGES